MARGAFVPRLSIDASGYHRLPELTNPDGDRLARPTRDAFGPPGWVNRVVDGLDQESVNPLDKLVGG